MSDLLGLTTSGGIRAGVDSDAWAEVRNCVAHVERSPAVFDGSFDEYVKQHEGDTELTRSLQNLVKKCRHCGKANGFSMLECNGCNMPLPADQELAHTENVLMSFVYGIAKTSRFPLTISIRKQEPDLLVFDDPLALCNCHINVIPTDAWIPDWRMLLRDPAKGLALVTKLENAAWGCVRDQLLSNQAWRQRCLRDGGPSDPEELRQYVCSGCNFPPSQFQLHIQYFLMPWLPSQYRSYLDGGQIVFNRWFPLDYIKAVLALNEPMEVKMETPLEDIIAKFDERVCYKECWQRQFDMVAKGHELLANWKPDDFSAVVNGPDVEGEAGGRAKHELLRDDKIALQSACAPADKTYYKYARAERVPEFGK